MKKIILLLTAVLIFTATYSQNVGIGETSPANKLSVKGSLSIGAGYSTTAAPTNGAIIQGSVGIGTASVPGTFTVNGNAVIGASLTNRATAGLTVSFSNATTYAANTDITDAARALSIVNEGTTANSMSVISMRSNPAGGANNQMLDMKFVNPNNGTSKLIYSFAPGGTFVDNFTFTSAGALGIGTTTPSGLLEAKKTTQLQSNLILSGQEYYQAGNAATGIALLAGVNRSANKQLWIADQDAVAAPGSANAVIRLMPNGPTIDAIGTDGVTAKNLTLGSGTGLITVPSLTASSEVYTDASKNLTSTPPTTGQLGYWTRNSASGYLYNTTQADNVGVGTTTPGCKLDVAGNGRFNVGGATYVYVGSGGGGYYGDATNLVTQVPTGGSFYMANVGIDGTRVSQSNGTLRVGGPSQGSANMYVYGQAGVGTITPAGKLSVVTTSSDGNVAAWGTGQMTVGQDLTTGGALGFSYSVANNAGYISSLSPGSSWKDLGVRALNTIFYYNGATEGMRLAQSGNVGIGTNNPLNKLQVEGNLHMDGNMIFFRSGAADQYDVLKWNSSADKIDMGGYSGVNLGYTSTGGPAAITNVLTVTNGNTVGINTIAPYTNLDVVGSIFTSLHNSTNEHATGEQGTSYIGHQTGSSVGSDGFNGMKCVVQAGTNGCGNTGDVAFATWECNTSSSREVMHITGRGNVGIGTSTPVYPLDIRSTYNTYYGTYWYYLGPGSSNGSCTNCTATNISLYTAGRIYCGGGEIDVASDERIKNIHGRSDNAADLRTLNQIAITDYSMKDQMKEGSASIKKVIAQQVKEVYPLAVKTNTGAVAVPNIYQRTDAYAVNGNEISFTLPQGLTASKDIYVGSNIKWYVFEKESGAQKERMGTITAISGDKMTMSTAEAVDKKLYKDEIFIYGTEVNDFLTVDYDAISMLNVSATQELSKQLKATQDKVSKLEAENAQLKSEQTDMMKSMKAQIDAINEKLNIRSGN